MVYKVLLADDEQGLRDITKKYLERNGFDVITAKNGAEAIAAVDKNVFDIIVLDIMMPEMRGDELCQAIKNNIETSHIPVILLTALNNEKDILSGLQIGADEYVVKPFNIGILKANVANLLANRALLRSKFANLDLNDEENDEDCINCSQDIDWKFIANVKKNVS